jgi:hypothetical protein
VGAVGALGPGINARAPRLTSSLRHDLGPVGIFSTHRALVHALLSGPEQPRQVADRVFLTKREPLKEVFPVTWPRRPHVGWLRAMQEQKPIAGKFLSRWCGQPEGERGCSRDRAPAAIRKRPQRSAHGQPFSSMLSTRVTGTSSGCSFRRR